jgi:hypothetical protein
VTQWFTKILPSYCTWYNLSHCEGSVHNFTNTNIRRASHGLTCTREPLSQGRNQPQQCHRKGTTTSLRTRAPE